MTREERKERRWGKEERKERRMVSSIWYCNFLMFFVFHLALVAYEEVRREARKDSFCCQQCNLNHSTPKLAESDENNKAQTQSSDNQSMVAMKRQTNKSNGSTVYIIWKLNKTDDMQQTYSTYHLKTTKKKKRAKSNTPKYTNNAKLKNLMQHENRNLVCDVIYIYILYRYHVISVFHCTLLPGQICPHHCDSKVS